MGRQDGLKMDHWAVTSHVGKPPFHASNALSPALIFSGNWSASAWFALLKGHLSEQAQGGFSKQSKGNVAPLPLGLNWLLLLWKICLCCANAFESLYMLCFLPFCCSRVLWNGWRNAFGACPARRWGPIHAWKTVSSGSIFWKFELKIKSVLKLVLRKIEFLPYLASAVAQQRKKVNSLPCAVTLIRLGSISLAIAH